MSTLQFVDKIDAAPTLRLNINDQSAFFLYRNPDFSPPPLRRVVVATMLRDGADIPASSYENRVIKLRLRVKGSTKDDLATKLQSLARELDRQNNILKWQSTLATNPVFFRTFRSPDYRLNIGGEGQAGEQLPEAIVDLAIVAEPFAYGIRVTQAPVTVNNDPAAGSNPCYFDVTGVTGDVPTPAFIQVDPSPAGGSVLETLLAIRRHGTPGGVYIFQAEAMTQGTDTTVQVNDAVMSGAGNNYSRTFDNVGDTNTMATRLSTAAFPAAASVDIRGQYRIFASVRPSTGTPNINVRVVANNAANTAVAVSGAYRQWVDLGVVSVPVGFPDPVYSGYSNSPQIPEPITLSLQAERTSGTATLDWDVIVAVPADESLCIISYLNLGGVETIHDGPNDKDYQRTVATAALYGGITNRNVERTGVTIELAPNQTNRIAFLLNTVSGSGDADDKTWTASVTVSFWPRWLYIRP